LHKQLPSSKPYSVDTQDSCVYIENFAENPCVIAKTTAIQQFVEIREIGIRCDGTLVYSDKIDKFSDSDDLLLLGN
jgi:hypothetical protein